MSMILMFAFFLGSPTIIPTVTEKPKRQLVAAIQGTIDSAISTYNELW